VTVIIVQVDANVGGPRPSGNDLDDILAHIFLAGYQGVRELTIVSARE